MITKALSLSFAFLFCLLTSSPLVAQDLKAKSIAQDESYLREVEKQGDGRLQTTRCTDNGCELILGRRSNDE